MTPKPRNCSGPDAVGRRPPPEEGGRPPPEDGGRPPPEEGGRYPPPELPPELPPPLGGRSSRVGASARSRWPSSLGPLGRRRVARTVRLGSLLPEVVMEIPRCCLCCMLRTTSRISQHATRFSYNAQYRSIFRSITARLPAQNCCERRSMPKRAASSAAGASPVAASSSL